MPSTLEETVAALDDQALSAAASEQSAVSQRGGDDTKQGSTSTRTSTKVATPAETQPDESETAARSLLGDETYDKVKGDPAALAKALHSDYTKKTQALATKRNFIESFEKEPEETLRRLAEQYGHTLTPKKSNQEEMTETITKDLEPLLGEEATTGLSKLIEAVVGKVFADKFGPLEQRTQAQEARAAMAEAETLYERMDTKYPGWRELESKMDEASKKFPAGPETDPFEYMEFLYKGIGSDHAVAEKVEKTMTRQNNAARNSERVVPGVKPSHVVDAPVQKDGKLKFESAWEAARKGKYLDPDEMRRAKREARASGSKR